jgi:hypothetical protein
VSLARTVWVHGGAPHRESGIGQVNVRRQPVRSETVAMHPHADYSLHDAESRPVSEMSKDDYMLLSLWI